MSAPNQDNPHPTEPEVTLPEPLIEALGALHRSTFDAEDAADGAARLREMAKAHLATVGGAREHEPAARDAARPPARLRRIALWGGGISSVAALLAIVVTLPMWSRARSGPETLTDGAVAQGSGSTAPGVLHQAGPMDLNHSGRVTIVDAQLLAIRLAESGDALDPVWDFTGDGAIDTSDTEAIIGVAVRLPEGAPGGAG